MKHSTIAMEFAKIANENDEDSYVHKKDLPGMKKCVLYIKRDYK